MKKVVFSFILLIMLLGCANSKLTIHKDLTLENGKDRFYLEPLPIKIATDEGVKEAQLCVKFEEYNGRRYYFLTTLCSNEFFKGRIESIKLTNNNLITEIINTPIPGETGNGDKFFMSCRNYNLIRFADSITITFFDNMNTYDYVLSDNEKSSLAIFYAFVDNNYIKNRSFFMR